MLNQPEKSRSILILTENAKPRTLFAAPILWVFALASPTTSINVEDLEKAPVKQSATGGIYYPKAGGSINQSQNQQSSHQKNQSSQNQEPNAQEKG